MAYKLKITCTSPQTNLQFAKRPDGKLVSTSSSDRPMWIVESNYKDSISFTDFLKQTGIIWSPSIAHPSDIRNCNGWKVETL